MTQDFEKAAADALVSGAERLGVDPFRLARFLGNGLLGDILHAFGERRGPDGTPQLLELAETYLDFLEREIATRSAPRPGSHGRGA